MQKKLLLLLPLLLLAGCSILPGMDNISTPNTYTQEAVKNLQIKPIITPITPSYLIRNSNKHYVYRIEPQDILSIIVWNNNEFNSLAQSMSSNSNTTGQTAGAPGYLVDYSGNIYLPLVGNLYVAGKTIEEIRTLITMRLNYYIRKPQVFVRIADYRSQKVYVMGEVLKAGFLPLNDQPLSITGAINQAGSLDPNASDPRHIYVIRGDFMRPHIYWLNAATPDALLLGEHFQLQQNDIVIVSTAAVTRWNRFLNQLLPSLQTIWYTKAITGK